jgi:hypothetical protein
MGKPMESLFTVMLKGLLAVLGLPAKSVCLAVMLWVPLRMLVALKPHTPELLTVVVPSTVRSIARPRYPLEP